MEPLGLSISEAGKALGGVDKPLSRTSIYRLTLAGDLETFKVGGRTLIAVDSIKRFVSQQRAA
ncbi:helix-turn-helix domain-containing protein [Sphingomonas sp. TZW2008]|uniref:helix-turn-helix domain-containing protein n=1 Tax=Sphingomonas sp. TZW2008 TaxID=1917973 RepID=UPI000A269039|nr:helix-turn-helix domain-containing protein [Sphingomonas sp. TZW2008]